MGTTTHIGTNVPRAAEDPLQPVRQWYTKYIGIEQLPAKVEPIGRPKSYGIMRSAIGDEKKE